MSEAERSKEARRLAGIVFDRTVPVDALLAQVIDRLKRSGADLAGVVQAPGPETGAGGVRDLRLHGLRGDWDVSILQNRGRHAQGCRLDSGAIADVAGRLETSLAEGADLLIVNRFGRAEAEGHGLRQVLVRAVGQDMPLLIAVRTDYEDAWDAFHGGLAETLPPDLDAILAWCRSLGLTEPARSLQSASD